MVDRAVTTAIESSLQHSVRGEVIESTPIVGGGLYLVRWLARAGATVPPWWSPARDMFLRNFWKQTDYLAGTVYTLQSKLTAIPVRVMAKDLTNKQHVKEADLMTEILISSAGFGAGWSFEYGKFIEDVITQDNGGFFEIIGDGKPDGPIIGPPLAVVQLDSSMCVKTGHPEFPVVYTDANGKMYKMHFTRVIYMAQMPSPIEEMFGVGVCSVSRCVNIAQTLFDILTYKMEKLGSRPHRSIVITKGGLDPSDIRTAFELAESNADNLGLTRYSKTIVTGSATLPEAALQLVELSSMPDGFNEQDSVTLGMATIALAFGMDARELFPALTTGATRAEALLQHMKQRGKGPGQILLATEQAFNYKFLPAHLRLAFDFQDDTQDRQTAEIRQIRANARMQDMSSGALNARTMREMMVKDGDISEQQFELLELEDGRLKDGGSILTLFYDREYDQFFDLLVADPLDTDNNDVSTMILAIDKNIREVTRVIAKADSQEKRLPATRALRALEELRKTYEISQMVLPTDADGNNGNGEKPPKQYIDTRVRRKDPVYPTPSSVREQSVISNSMMRDDEPI